MQQLRWLALMSVATTLTAATAWAQTDAISQTPKSIGSPTVALPSSGPVTPEMWFYMQEYQRYQQPKEAVRRKAELRAAQRQNRLEAQRWFGFSKLRPVANPIPYYGTYSPSWVGNAWEPYSWHGYGSPYVSYHTTSRNR